MIKKYLSFALCCLLLIASNSSFISAQTKTANDASSIVKIKAIVVNRENKRVKVKMLDGTKLKGEVTQAGEDSFKLTDAKTGQSRSIAYRDISKVERSGISNTDIIALGIVIGAAAVVIGFFTGICRNEGTC